MDEYLIECEECDSETYAIALEKPIFCPMCGRRAEVEKKSLDIDILE
jgi:hypothetical protein